MYDQHNTYWDMPWYYDTYQWLMSNPFIDMVTLTVILMLSTCFYVTRKVQ